MEYHTPVLRNEVLQFLRVEKGKAYVDCTLGDGGHALEILKRGGNVLGMDFSKKSLSRAEERIRAAGFGASFVGILGNFKDLENLALANGFDKVSGVLFDLGFSSSQLEDEFGLSFAKDEPLDMRMDKSLGVPAADLVNALSERELANLFYTYSGERLAHKFAKAIVIARKLKRFETTADLVGLIVDLTSPGYEHGRIHPATRVFQALRIAVNDEMGNLEKALPQAARLLLPGGRMLVITFHSLEDHLVKEFGRGVQPTIKRVTRKSVKPTATEVRNNVRARSAKLYVFEKI